MSKLPECPRTNCKRPAQTHRVYGILPCKQCVAEDQDFRLTRHPEFVTLSKQTRFQEQRDHNSKDMAQPWADAKGTPNLEFVKMYPEYRDNYFTKKQLEKL